MWQVWVIKSPSVGQDLMLGNDKKRSLTPDELMGIVNALESFTTINTLLVGASESVGLKYSSYHHFPAVGAVDYDNTCRFHGYNIPDSIKTYYETHNKYDGDPVIVTALAKGEFIWLSDSINEPYIKKRKHEKFIQWTLDNIGDGLCCPLYGPDNRKGYAFIGFDRDKADFDPIMPYQMQMIVQIMHVRYCLMVKALQRQINLTARESEVLELITYGKTNPEIALILGISPRTVAIHASKIYIKLETTDRVSTAMRAQTIDLVI